MSIEKLEKKVAQIQTRRTEISQEMREHERGLEREQKRLIELQAKAARLMKDIESGKSEDTEDGIELAEILREKAQSENSVAELERKIGPALEKLQKEDDKLRDELMEVNKKLARTQLSAAVMEYEKILRQALPVASRIRSLAYQAGITLESPNCLVHRDEDSMTLCGYPLQV